MGNHIPRKPDIDLQEKKLQRFLFWIRDSYLVWACLSESGVCKDVAKPILVKHMDLVFADGAYHIAHIKRGQDIQFTMGISTRMFFRLLKMALVKYGIEGDCIRKFLRESDQYSTTLTTTASKHSLIFKVEYYDETRKLVNINKIAAMKEKYKPKETDQPENTENPRNNPQSPASPNIPKN